MNLREEKEVLTSVGEHDCAIVSGYFVGKCLVIVVSMYSDVCIISFRIANSRDTPLLIASLPFIVVFFY